MEILINATVYFLISLVFLILHGRNRCGVIKRECFIYHLIGIYSFFMAVYLVRGYWQNTFSENYNHTLGQMETFANVLFLIYGLIKLKKTR
ncbi:hypothetical protein [Riemerella anatipestifer]|nr:hypothetical protein [Riemerella anatipestifer]